MSPSTVARSVESRLTSFDVDRFYHRGQVYFITGDYERAITEYRHSSELDPVFIFSHIQLAVAQYKSGSTEKAMHQFWKFLKDFESPEVWNYYGELLLDQQKYEEAVTAFRKSIVLDADSFVTHSLLHEHRLTRCHSTGSLATSCL